MLFWLYNDNNIAKTGHWAYVYFGDAFKQIPIHPQHHKIYEYTREYSQRVHYCRKKKTHDVCVSCICIVIFPFPSTTTPHAHISRQHILHLACVLGRPNESRMKAVAVRHEKNSTSTSRLKRRTIRWSWTFAQTKWVFHYSCHLNWSGGACNASFDSPTSRRINVFLLLYIILTPIKYGISENIIHGRILIFSSGVCLFHIYKDI